MDSKTISGYFVSYCIGSRGSRFFRLSHTTRIIESDKVVYFEDDFGFDGSNGPKKLTLEKKVYSFPLCLFLIEMFFIQWLMN